MCAQPDGRTECHGSVTVHGTEQGSYAARACRPHATTKHTAIDEFYRSELPGRKMYFAADACECRIP